MMQSSITCNAKKRLITTATANWQQATTKQKHYRSWPRDDSRGHVTGQQPIKRR